jgi:acyl-CoA synthetase (AMP-forming)/AMP-acid ligase II
MHRGTSDTIDQLLLEQQNGNGEVQAILAPARKPLSYAVLAQQMSSVSRALQCLSIGRGDRVAVVLPDGPEMAVAFLTFSACATFAPLNPAYGVAEFDFYLADLQAKAVVLPADQDSPARAVARSRGIPVIELISHPDVEAGVFELRGAGEPARLKPCAPHLAEPEDVALVLHTSGTTSRPKMVPLTHRNLCSSARHIVAALALTREDRALSIMPLFHIHGLVGVVLASVTAGGSIVCPPGFDAARFYEWLKEFRPTWYSAVPTMHQAILGGAATQAEIVRRSSLRFIRSSSSPLPPPVMRELESVFNVPVIESYGMTEASHQMASNPLPPGPRKPGSVGLAAGPEIAIVDEQGQRRGSGETGEIVIRGPNVTRGYANNPEANRTAFVDGWFRTGDQGYLDSHGYLFITGRLKEIINRGGEKIAPRDIDDALLCHPGVRQAVSFAVPHPTLGEDVAAAVVPKDGEMLTETDLRAAAARSLPGFKVPSRIVVLKEIPKGPTGKIQRIGLADRLARELAVAYEPPEPGLETLTATTIQQVLQRSPVGRQDNFFALGGDSIRATQVAVRLAQSLSLDISPVILFHHPTVALLAAELGRLQQTQVDALAAELARLPPEAAERMLREASEGD